MTKKLQPAIFITLLLLLFSLFLSVSGTIVTTGSLVNYTEYKEERFSFQYPKGWEIKTSDPQKLFYRYSPTKIYNRSTMVSTGTEGATDKNTMFQILTNTTTLSESDFVNMTIANNYAIYKDLIPISASKTRLGKKQGTLFEYQYTTDSGEKRRGSDFITVLSDIENLYKTGYIIRYSSPNRYYIDILPVLKKFYTSFKFL